MMCSLACIMQVSIHAIVNTMQDLECNESIPETPSKLSSVATCSVTRIRPVKITWPQKRFCVQTPTPTNGFQPIGNYTFLIAHVHDIPRNECLLETLCEASNDVTFGVLFSMVYFLLELQNRTLWMLPATNDTAMTKFARNMMQNTSEWGVPYLDTKHTKMKHTTKGQIFICGENLCYTTVCKTASMWLPLSPQMQRYERLMDSSSDAEKLAFMLRMRRYIVRCIDKKFNCKLSEDAGNVEHNDIHDVMFVSKFVMCYPIRNETSQKRQKCL